MFYQILYEKLSEFVKKQNMKHNIEHYIKQYMKYYIKLSTRGITVPSPCAIARILVIHIKVEAELVSKVQLIPDKKSI